MAKENANDKLKKWLEHSEHPFPNGTIVVTNNDYFKQFGRKVIGESVFLDNVPVTEHVTVVRWEHQEGNIIPEHQGNMVLMMTRDLEKYNLDKNLL